MKVFFSEIFFLLANRYLIKIHDKLMLGQYPGGPGVGQYTGTGVGQYPGGSGNFYASC